MVEQLSAGKAGAAAALAGEDTVIIGADTVVICDGKVFGKPRDGQDAVRMLTALSGREHEVCTGVTVRRGGRVLTGHELTRVRFRALSREEIDAYVATGEPMDKAGAYGIQGRGALLVEGIVGDYYHVMGLPVCRLGQMLRQFGVECLGQRNG